MRIVYTKTKQIIFLKQARKILHMKKHNFLFEINKLKYTQTTIVARIE